MMARICAPGFVWNTFMKNREAQNGLDGRVLRLPDCDERQRLGVQADRLGRIVIGRRREFRKRQSASRSAGSVGVAG